jgi:hypothetical protein
MLEGTGALAAPPRSRESSQVPAISPVAAVEVVPVLATAFTGVPGLVAAAACAR